MKKNVASQKWYVFAFDRTDNTPKTGDAANITAKIIKDGGSATATNDTNPTEIEDGIYAFDLTQAETNAHQLVILPESSTSDIQVVGLPQQLFTVPQYFSDAAFDSSGQVTVGAMGTGVIAAATFAANAITSTVVADNTITANKLDSNCITAGKIATNAITTSEVDSSVYDDIWAVATRTITGAVDLNADQSSVTIGTVTTNTDMRGTDGANTTTPPTVAAIRAEMDSNSTKLTDIEADADAVAAAWKDGGRLDLLLDAVKAKTDQFVFTVANQVDANALTATTVDLNADQSGVTIGTVTTVTNQHTLDEIADAIHDEIFEGSLTLRKGLRLFAAVLTGKANGLDGSTANYRDNADSKNRVTATVDEHGNRTAVTLDAD